MTPSADRVGPEAGALMDSITLCLKFFTKHAHDCSGAEIACSCGLSQTRTKALSELAALKQAELAAASAQMEQDCKFACVHCKNGKPVFLGGTGSGMWWHDLLYCGASAIRNAPLVNGGSDALERLLAEADAKGFERGNDSGWEEAIQLLAEGKKSVIDGEPVDRLLSIRNLLLKQREAEARFDEARQWFLPAIATSTSDHEYHVGFDAQCRLCCTERLAELEAAASTPFAPREGQ